ncbi:hypothetical protein A374_14140 [Fictibacillus macauensis ZFHKF-1]|uniref:DMT family transporter n=1 Tax=Fictibacillus macauensis ZFHKF-1 TaxID=1196324 RepID=I8UDF1_9BACL|nr:DMT family transporter [Fictibacillus macauensis]EIT84838.1 hypothetical protein A374_14140 [Fictibacillus macauensis ZFHKF-1]
MIVGILFALVGGALVGLQNIFNSKVNEKAHSWATTMLVLALGFLASLILGIIFEGASLFHVTHMKTWYYFSGLIGVGVVTCVTQGVKRLSPTIAISIVLTAQLISALILDSLGSFGLAKVPFTWSKLIGVLVVIVGIVLFKVSDAHEEVSKSVKQSA